MDPREERARDIQRAISAVLLSDWDPLGRGGRPEDGDDEYDSYVGPVYRLLSNRATPQTIAEHLSKVESEAFGFATPPAKLIRVAEKLLCLDVRLGGVSGAT